MKKTLLLFCFLCYGLLQTASAQAEFSSDTTRTALDPKQSDIVGHAFVNNLAPQVKNYRWVATELEMPGDWNWAICDKNNCYTPGVDSMDFTLGPAEAGRMDVHIYPGTDDGTTAMVKVRVTDLQNPDFTAEGFYFFSTLLTTSSQEAELAAVKVFPNPVSSELRVEGLQLDEVSQLSLYSLDGRLLAEKAFQGQSTISMADLPVGLYLFKVQLPNKGATFQQLIQKQ